MNDEPALIENLALDSDLDLDFGFDEGNDGFGPTDGGQVDSGGTEEQYEDLPILDVNEVNDHLVTVKVDGEELRVPLREALSGYQRQADYTRKTQSLAERERQLEYYETLSRALEQDFDTTVNILRQRYGHVEADRMVAQAQDDQGYWDSDPWGENQWESNPDYDRIDRIEQQLSQMREQQELQEAQKVIASTLQGLQGKYGQSFNPQEVVRAALDRGITDPNYFEMVYRDLAYDKLLARQQAARTASEQRQAENATRRAAAVNASTSLHSGNGVSPEGVAQAPPRALTVAEAFALAEQEYGALS
jgi:hypothetical protein